MTQFGRYELLERVAMGGMAEVFRARVLGPDGFSKDVCIKRILPQFCGDPDFVKMFIDEARLASRLQHANVVQLFDFDQVDGAYFIAMEFIQGKDLRTVIKQGFAAGLPPGPYRAALMLAEMCKGLDYAHNVDGIGLVHRDISPHNVLVSMRGDVKVMDFGIAKAADRVTRTSTGIIKGKIPYMAPEQANGTDLDHRVDQYATGLVLYEMLVGRRAYDGPDPVALRKALMGEVQPPSLLVPDVPPELDEIFLRMCALNPDDRFPDMRAAERALQRFVYARAPDDSELDVAAYMAAVFGAAPAVRAKTAVMPGAPELGSGRSSVPSSPVVSITEPPHTSPLKSDARVAPTGVFAASAPSITMPPVEDAAPTVLSKPGLHMEQATSLPTLPMAEPAAVSTRTMAGGVLASHVDTDTVLDPRKQASRFTPVVGAVVLLLGAGALGTAWMATRPEPAVVLPAAVTSPPAAMPPVPTPVVPKYFLFS